MVCLGLEPGAAGWYAQTNPLSCVGSPFLFLFGIHRTVLCMCSVSITLFLFNNG